MPSLVLRLLLAAVLLPASLALTGPSSPGSVGAVAAQAATKTTDAGDLERIESYLNSIDRMRARFVQVSSNGGYSEGEMLLDRPGRVRFEYDPPNPTLLIGNGLELTFYDRELEQASYIPMWETPLWFLLKEKIELGGGIEVLGIDRGPGTLTLRLRQRETPQQGEVMIQFSDQPLEIKSWQITDAQGVTTQISLLEADRDPEIDPKAFETKSLPGIEKNRAGGNK